MKRITAFAYDDKLKSLLCFRERKTVSDETFEIYQLDLQNFFSPMYNRNLADVDITEAAKSVIKFDVFTKPISVFAEDEVLYGAACFDSKTNEVYALIGNSSFSLLYRAAIGDKRENIRFE